MSAPATNETVAAAPAEEPAEPAEPEPAMLVVSAADTYARVNHNLAQLWKANRARFVAREMEEESEAAAEHQAELAAQKAQEEAAAKAQEKAAQEAQAAEAARAEAAAKRAAEEVAKQKQNTSLTDAYTETNHVTTPAPKAKAEKVSEEVVEEPVEPKFPTDWIKNDMKYNADVDTMAQREKSIQDRVKEQQSWKSKGEAWIQTKVFHLRSWGSTVA